MKLCWRFYGFSQASRQLPSPLSPVMNGECLRPFNFFWISFSVGLRSFFKSFFKQNDPEEFYGLIKTKIDVQHPGGRLWQNNDIRVDRGQTLADGSTNIVWQRQAQTKNPALKKIKKTHAKIVTQRVFPDSDARKLEEDIYEKLGWVCRLIIFWIPFTDWNHSGWNQLELCSVISNRSYFNFKQNFMFIIHRSHQVLRPFLRRKMRSCCWEWVCQLLYNFRTDSLIFGVL